MANAHQVRRWIQDCVRPHLRPDVLRVEAVEDDALLIVLRQPGTDGTEGDHWRLTLTREPVLCPRCDGCGKIADSDSGEAWSEWLALPVQSAVAVVAGIVKPIPCPDCGGSGSAP